jgi:pimeloyl-ACP methyl ester carboxylesterase
MQTSYFAASDGTRLAVHEMGVGRPLVLLHGYFSDATTNWIKYGTAAKLVAAGYRVIMPDLRAHGMSDKPHDPAAYPPDILADDGLAVIDRLRLTDFDLGGYSLGGRTVARMLVKGCRPAKAIISGMGLQGLTDTGQRAAHFRHILGHLGQHERGSPEWMAEAFLKTSGGDPVALALILDSFVDTSLLELQVLSFPIAVICGGDDDDNGSAEALAAALPQGRSFQTPGNHMSAVTKPEFGTAFAHYLQS